MGSIQAGTGYTPNLVTFENLQLTSEWPSKICQRKVIDDGRIYGTTFKISKSFEPIMILIEEN